MNPLGWPDWQAQKALEMNISGRNQKVMKSESGTLKNKKLG